MYILYCSHGDGNVASEPIVLGKYRSFSQAKSAAIDIRRSDGWYANIWIDNPEGITIWVMGIDAWR